MKGVRQAATIPTGATALICLALGLAGCGSTNVFSTSALDLFSTSSKATSGDAGAAADPNANVECPGIEVRSGAATLMIGSKPGEGEPSALDLRYQVTIIRTARESPVPRVDPARSTSRFDLPSCRKVSIPRPSCRSLRASR